VGKFCPQPVPMKSLNVGEVGYIVTGIRDVTEIKIGDTLTLADTPAKEMLPGYKEVRPMVFSGLYPLDTSDFHSRICFRPFEICRCRSLEDGIPFPSPPQKATDR